MYEVNPIFFEKIKSIILDSRTKIYRVANTELLFSYWEIGRIIIEEEQSGELRAEYGKETLKRLSQFLTLELGKGFDESNLRNMRSFFIAFPIRDTLRHELSWSHYRLLSRIESIEKRRFYLNEAIHSNWNSFMYREG